MSATLTVEYHKSSEQKSLFGFALRVVVTNAVDMPAEVFIFQRGATPAPAIGETVRDGFVAITDPVDLEELPAGAPDLANEIPYYRLAEVTLAFRSMRDLEDTRQLIANDLQMLVHSLQAMDTFELTDTVTYE